MYVRVNDQGQAIEFPFKPEKLRRMHRNVSFPSTISNEILADYNVFPVTQTSAPTFNSELEKLSNDVELINGKWTLTYTINPRTDLELKTQVDEKVQQKLDESLDLVIQYLENNEPVPHDLSLYRRQLRTVHLQQTYPHEVEWPSIENDSSV